MARFFQSRTEQPVSQFVPLPLDLIAARIGQEQQQRDILGQQLEEDLGVQTRFIPGSPDEQRVSQVQQQFDTDIEDLSTRFRETDDIRDVSRDLRSLQRSRNKLLSPSGEFGIIGSNYDTYAAQNQALEDSGFSTDVIQAQQQRLFNDFVQQGGTGFDPNTSVGQRFGEVLIPEYQNIQNFMSEAAANINPNKVADFYGWQLASDGTYRNNEYEKVELTADHIKQVVINSTLTDPQMQDNIRFMKQAGYSGDMIDTLISNSASSIGNEFQQLEVTNKEEIKFPPSDFGFGSSGHLQDVMAGLSTKDRVNLDGERAKLVSTFGEFSSIFGDDGNVTSAIDFSQDGTISSNIGGQDVDLLQLESQVSDTTAAMNPIDAQAVRDSYLKDNYGKFVIKYQAVHDRIKTAGGSDKDFWQYVTDTELNNSAVKNKLYTPQSQDAAKEANEGFQNDILFSVDTRNALQLLDENGKPVDDVSKNELFTTNDQGEKISTASVRFAPYTGQLIIQDTDGNSYTPFEDDVNDQTQAYSDFTSAVNNNALNLANSSLSPVISEYQEYIPKANNSGYPVMLKVINDDLTVNHMKVYVKDKSDLLSSELSWSIGQDPIEAFNLAEMDLIKDASGNPYGVMYNSMDQFNLEQSARVFDSFNPTQKGN